MPKTENDLFKVIRADKGKPCGKGYIPAGRKCLKSSSQRSINQEPKRINPIVPTAIAVGGVAGIAGIAGASVLGGKIAADKGKDFLEKAKREYTENFTTSGKVAQQLATKMKAPKVKSKQIVFTVGGFGTKDAFSESQKLQDHIKSLGIKDTHVEPIPYQDFNVVSNPQSDGKLKAVAETTSKFIQTIFIKKHNPVAVRLAAKVLAYQKANPHAQIQLVGHSGGGLTVQETHEILHTLGVKVKSTAIGSPDVGVIPGNGDVVTATSKHDNILEQVSKGKGVNGVPFDNVTDHAQDEYFKDPHFRKFIKNRLDTRKYKKDSATTLSKPCGKGYIPRSKKCRIGVNRLTPRKIRGVDPVLSPLLGVGAIALGGIAATSVGSAAIQHTKQEYVAGFTKSGIQAQKAADIAYQKLDKEGKLPIVGPSVKQVIFTVGGFGTKDAFSESVKLKKNIHSLDVKDTQVIPIPYHDFNVATNVEKDPLGSAGEALAKFVDTTTVKKRNVTAVKLAATVLIYKKANPHVQIQLVGHSGGGLTVQETHEILHTLNVKPKTTAIGSPDVGILPGTGNVVTATSKHDKILKLSGGKGINSVPFDNVDAHGQDEYFKDPHFREFAKKRLTPGSRLDSITSGKSKPCGKGYIPRFKKCRIGINSPAAGVIGGGSVVVAATAAGAGLLGVPLSVYTAQKLRFQANFPKSAELAKQQSKTYSVPDQLKSGFRAVSDQNPDAKSQVTNKYSSNKPEQITFFVGGVGGKDGLEADYMGQQVSKLLPNHHVVGIEAPEQDVVPEEGDSVANPRFLKKVFKSLLGQNLEKGRSDVAVRIAARAYSYHQKHPDLPINLVGQSGGGMPVREAYEILDRMGVKGVKVATTGSPYFGLTRPVGISLVSPETDPVDKIYGFTMPNKVKVDAQGHSRYYSKTLYNSSNQLEAGKHAVVNQSVKKVLDEYFDRSHKLDSAGVDVTKSISPTSLRLQQQIKTLLSRSLRKSVLQLSNVKITNGVVTGTFNQSGVIYTFTLKNDNITYQRARGIRKDAAPRKIKRCQKGIGCGDTCISPTDVCKIKAGQIASPSEIVNLNQTMARFEVEQHIKNPTPPTPPSPPTTPPANDYVTNPETGDKYTIRDLKKIAREKSIVNYGVMPIDELRESLKLADKNPESRDRITKGVAKRQSFTAGVKKAAGLSGRNPNERGTKKSLGDTVDTWKKIEALSKFAGNSPLGWGAAAVGAFLLGTTIRTYERAKNKYQEGYNASARFAEERAVKINLQHPVERDGEVVMRKGEPLMTSSFSQNNITFAVGSGRGYGAEEIKKALQSEKDPSNRPDYWFTHSNYVIPFNLQETGAPYIEGATKNPQAQVANEVVNGFGNYLENFKRGRSQDAVDLAANIYAHAIAVDQVEGKPVNKYKNINILAHGTGGQVTKEALEILARMDLKGYPSGKQVLKQVNAVYLGTPHFGFAENVSRRQRTIISANDPISNIPAFGDQARQQWISSVRGHSAEDYIKDPRVRDSIREAFGYHQSSPEEIRRNIGLRNHRISTRAAAVEERGDSKCHPGSVPCGDRCLPPGFKCHKTDPKFKRKRFMASIGRGVVGSTVGGIGQDLERAYLRTRKLSEDVNNARTKKKITRKQKFKKDILHEAKLVGVQLGQGTISKKIKEIDTHLINAHEKLEAAPTEIHNLIHSAKGNIQQANVPDKAKAITQKMKDRIKSITHRPKQDAY